MEERSKLSINLRWLIITNKKEKEKLLEKSSQGKMISDRELQDIKNKDEEIERLFKQMYKLSPNLTKSAIRMTFNHPPEVSKFSSFDFLKDDSEINFLF
jgi:hypothetical protein